MKNKRYIILVVIGILILSVSPFISHVSAYNTFGGRYPSNLNGVGIGDYIAGYYYKYDNNISGNVDNVTFWCYICNVGSLFNFTSVIYDS